jgi:hypothetical protein
MYVAVVVKYHPLLGVLIFTFCVFFFHWSSALNIPQVDDIDQYFFHIFLTHCDSFEKTYS